jgi:Acyclic terpene utilisation family protein AtuA
MPVVEALKSNPDIVVCGRVTDTGITTAALIHEFGWSKSDYDKLAHGIVASHLIECGAQATGGNFTDWKKVPSFENMGYPIVECLESGEFYLTNILNKVVLFQLKPLASNSCTKWVSPKPI